MPLRASDETRQIVRLVVSELVSNAVLHANRGQDAPVRLRIDDQRGMVRIEVADEGKGFRRESLASANRAPHGRGLLIVERLSLRWGIEDGRRTTVWVELPLA
jgi:anti-sigma regulatory factor (Ser/Thr protein kinase)